MASLQIRAENIGVDDVLLLPMGREGTITAVKPVGTRASYVQYKVDNGPWVRVQRYYEFTVKVGS